MLTKTARASLIRGKKNIYHLMMISLREISYIMRYLLQFPSEAQVRDYIITKLEDDEPSDYIKYEKFEPYMI